MGVRFYPEKKMFGSLKGYWHCLGRSISASEAVEVLPRELS
jgi:hypothetical protein